MNLPNPAPSSFDRDEALQLDHQDALARFRDEFIIPDPDLLYMDGNSLGRLPRRTRALLQTVMDEQWGERLVRAWGEGWYTAPLRLGDKIGALIGAAAGQVVVSDSTTVNLYKLVHAALRLRRGRSVVLSDTLNFPSDLYILQGCLQAAGELGRQAPVLRLVDPPGPEESANCTAAVLDAIDGDTALVVLSHVVFKSGYRYDAAAITRRAHEHGALVLWDLSHAAGAVPVDLDAWEADFAVGCTYKYLNGGPGAPAFLYVRRALQDQALSPVWGWFGQERPFAFDLDYHPAAGIARFLCGTPPVLSLLAIESGVDLLAEAGIPALYTKSMAQTDYLIRLYDRALAPLGFTLGTPRDPQRRGSHVSLRHPEGYRINRALIESAQVVPDFREPDNLRLGIAPLYTRFIDIYDTVARIARVVRDGAYLRYPATRASVT